jgi:pyruvate decarboxylase
LGFLADGSSFVICNKGYTIERLIHGMEAEYNDIQEWKFKDLLDVFGADAKKSKTYQVRTKKETDELFKDENFSSAPYIQVRARLPLVLNAS